MNDVERDALKYKYITDPKFAEKEVAEFTRTLQTFFDLMGDAEFINNLKPADMLNILIDLKEIDENIRGFVLKYGFYLQLKDL